VVFPSASPGAELAELSELAELAEESCIPILSQNFTSSYYQHLSLCILKEVFKTIKFQVVKLVQSLKKQNFRALSQTYARGAEWETKYQFIAWFALLVEFQRTKVNSY
jgi:hypothetical protein